MVTASLTLAGCGGEDEGSTASPDPGVSESADAGVGETSSAATSETPDSGATEDPTTDGGEPTESAAESESPDLGDVGQSFTDGGDPTESATESEKPDAGAETPTTDGSAATEEATDGGDPGDGGQAFAGTAEEILGKVLEGVDGETHMPMVMGIDINPENVRNTTGLSEGDFDRLVLEAYASTGALITTAHLLVLFRCRDAGAASEAKALIADGFDSGRWICVYPDVSMVIEAGDCVILISSKQDIAEAVSAAFVDAAGGSAGESLVFYRQ